VTLRRQAILAGVAVFAACGDTALSHGMRSVGAVSLENWTSALTAVFTPWVALGIVLLMAFFAAYLAALSFADLTYVLPATSIGYVLMALMARFLLHESVSWTRWLGIALIAGGVGFVTRGPALTGEKEQAFKSSVAGDD
jgi:drug/metabolite transporter (DMT)-like permease